MLGRRYAKAIFDLGSSQGSLDHIGRDLRTLTAAMRESSELAQTLSSPAIRRSDRRKVIDALLARMSAHPTTKNTIYLLLDRERLGSLTLISKEIDRMIEAKAGRVSAEVVSAKPLDPAQLSQITSALEKLSGKRVSVASRQDPELLGGVVAKVGDTVYDGSLRTQLRNLRDELSR
jgi:F-type H+-transporting ATPase subunit delta